MRILLTPASEKSRFLGLSPLEVIRRHNFVNNSGERLEMDLENWQILKGRDSEMLPVATFLTNQFPGKAMSGVAHLVTCGPYCLTIFHSGWLPWQKSRFRLSNLVTTSVSECQGTNFSVHIDNAFQVTCRKTGDAWSATIDTYADEPAMASLAETVAALMLNALLE